MNLSEKKPRARGRNLKHRPKREGRSSHQKYEQGVIDRGLCRTQFIVPQHHYDAFYDLAIYLRASHELGIKDKAKLNLLLKAFHNET